MVTGNYADIRTAYVPATVLTATQISMVLLISDLILKNDERDNTCRTNGSKPAESSDIYN
jgi:hypothetical protein